MKNLARRWQEMSGLQRLAAVCGIPLYASAVVVLAPLLILAGAIYTFIEAGNLLFGEFR